MATGTRQAGRSTSGLSHPDKVLYPGQGITKQKLFDYYRLVAARMLPELSRRPIVLVRCPEGHHKTCFFQKHPGSSLPAQLGRIPIREGQDTEDYVYVEDEAGLLALVQMNALEIHCWGSRIEDIESPDRLVMDLDPDPEVPVKAVVEAALMLRDLLLGLKLKSYPRLSGGKGLHLVIPILPVQDFAQAKSFTQTIAQELERQYPQDFIASAAKKKRKGRIFVDYLRNGRGATSIATYSTRARPGAPVALPVSWKQVTARLKFSGVTIENIRPHLGKHPWPDLSKVRQRLP